MRRWTNYVDRSVFGLTPEVILAADIQPTRLRCEYRENPLGIDTDKPRLSWIVTPTDSDRRGVGQTAYQILVAGTREQLDRDQGDFWDSGKVVSDETIQVPYDGSKSVQASSAGGRFARGIAAGRRRRGANQPPGPWDC